MKAKRFVLLVLVLATLFSAFAVSCRKKPTATNDPEPTADPQAADDYKDFDFSLKENGLYLVEIPAEKKASFQKETLIIPGFFTGEELPVPVEELGSYACQGLTTLKKVTVSYPISVIGGYAFKGCTSLTDVELSGMLERLSTGAFEGCAALTEITLPKSLSTIGDDVFQGCTALTKITYEGTMEQWEAIRKSPDDTDWLGEGDQVILRCSDAETILRIKK